MEESPLLPGYWWQRDSHCVSSTFGVTLPEIEPYEFMIYKTWLANIVWFMGLIHGFDSCYYCHWPFILDGPLVSRPEPWIFLAMPGLHQARAFRFATVAVGLSGRSVCPPGIIQLGWCSPTQLNIDIISSSSFGFTFECSPIGASEPQLQKVNVRPKLAPELTSSSHLLSGGKPWIVEHQPSIRHSSLSLYNGPVLETLMVLFWKPMSNPRVNRMGCQ